MARHQLSQKEMGCITLFAVSLYAAQVHADGPKAPLITNYSASTQLDKPNISFDMSKKSVEDLPAEIEKPRFSFFNSKPKQAKEQVLVPKILDQLPDMDAPVQTEAAPVDDKQTNRSFFSFIKKEPKKTPEPEPIQPVALPTPTVTRKYDNHPIKPAIIGLSDNGQLVDEQVSTKPKSKSSFFSFGDKKKNVEPEKANSTVVSTVPNIINSPNSTVATTLPQPNITSPKPDPISSKTNSVKVISPTIKNDSKKSVSAQVDFQRNALAESVQNTRQAPVINTAQSLNSRSSNAQYIDLTAAQNTAQPAAPVITDGASVVHKQSLISRAKSFWPFKSGKHNLLTNVNAVERSNVVSQPDTAILPVNKPTLVYSKPIQQKADVKQNSSAVKPDIQYPQQSDSTVSQQNYIVYQNKEEKNKKFSFNALKKNIDQVIKPKENDDFRFLSVNDLSDFNFDPKQVDRLPVITTQAQSTKSSTVKTTSKAIINKNNSANSINMGLFEAIQVAISRHPRISETVASLAAQNSNIDVAKAGYYPQISSDYTTGSLIDKETRKSHTLSLTVEQMVWDFGKVKSSVNYEEARLQAKQAEVLAMIDQVALEVATGIVNVRRYEELTRIAREQIAGIARIREITNLRAKAGITSQADPVQAQTYYEQAESNLIAQETALTSYKHKLNSLMGMDVSRYNFQLPKDLIINSDIYSEPRFNEIPKMMVARAEVIVAEINKKQTDLSRYPSLSIKGGVSQAIVGVNPNNKKELGTDSAIMLTANSRFYQGGSIGSRSKAAAFAEEAARSKVNATYLETIDSIRLAQNQVENKQKLMKIGAEKQLTSIRTKELYQEQYNLNKRSAVDLLNAELAIHSANTEIENSRYDIYDNLVQYIMSSGKSRNVYQLNNTNIQGVELRP